MSVDEHTFTSPEAQADTRFTLVPSQLARDPSVSVTAKAVYLVLDDRQGNRRDVHVNRTTLAADLGVSVATVKRAVAELIEAGWIQREQSRYTNRYATRNPARTRRQPGHLRPDSTPSRVTSDPSAGSPVTHVSNIPLGIAKQASNSSGIDPRTVEPAAAAGASRTADAAVPPPGDDLRAFIDTFRKLAHIDLAATNRVVAALTTARRNGWTAQGLAVALRDKPRSPQAGTGVVVLDLEALASNLPNLTSTSSTAAASSTAQTYSLGMDDKLIDYCQSNGIAYEHSSDFTREDAANSPKCESHDTRQLSCAICRNERSTLTLITLRELIEHGLNVTRVEINDWEDCREIEICLGFTLIDDQQSEIIIYQCITPDGKGHKVSQGVSAWLRFAHARMCSNLDEHQGDDCVWDIQTYDQMSGLFKAQGFTLDDLKIDAGIESRYVWAMGMDSHEKWIGLLGAGAARYARGLVPQAHLEWVERLAQTAPELIDSHMPHPAKVSTR